jgi:hypothetical protein
MSKSNLPTRERDSKKGKLGKRPSKEEKKLEEEKEAQKTEGSELFTRRL